jgi:hypothetical protein
MQVKFKIEVNGADITAKVQDRLLSLTVTDNQGIESDSYQLELDNRDDALAIPPTGASVQLYAGIDKLEFLGHYTVDTVRESGQVRTLTLSGSSADLTSRLKSHRQQSWDNTTLENVLSEISSRHGLTLALHDDYKLIEIEHIDQTAESDLGLINRLADEYNALFKIADQRLIFTKKQAGETLVGQSIPVQTLNPFDVLSWDYQQSERSEVTQVKAKWRSVIKSDEQWEVAGEDGVTHIINRQHRTRQDAITAAKSKLSQLKSGQETLSLNLVVTPKTPLIRAEHRFSLQGLSSATSGIWLAKTVTHTLTSQGYALRIEALKPAQAF